MTRRPDDAPDGSADEGYTLAECLVALFVIGLALAGLSAGVVSIARQQARAVAAVGAARNLRAVHEGLDRFLEGQGPFIAPGTEAFEGTSAGFRFRCGVDDDCRAWLAREQGGVALHLASLHGSRTLPMAGVRSAQFVYAGVRTIGPDWPAPGPGTQPLRSIGLMAETDAGSVPVADVRVWLDQGVYCDFDAILRDCRR